MKYRIQLLLSFFIGICTIFSCNNTIERRVGKKIEDCDTKDCTIRITDLTDFKWDEMFVTNFSISQEGIESSIGTAYPQYEEFSGVMIFLNKGKIVHYENNGRDIETATDKAVIFDYPDSIGYRIYTPASATFKAKIDTFSKGKYYTLYK